LSRAVPGRYNHVRSVPYYNEALPAAQSRAPARGKARVVVRKTDVLVRLASFTTRASFMSTSLIEKYLKTRDPAAIAPGFLAYLANLECVARVAPDVARSIVQELADQRHNIKLIASENFSSLATQCAMANLLTDKYAEGIPHHRFYAGCDNVDSIEALANQRARELFGAAHAYAQPHSGADANLVAFWAILRARVELPKMAEILGAEGPDALVPADWYKMTPAQWNVVRQALGNQRLLGLDLASGGHLTHGYRLNSSGKMFEAHGYTVDRQTFLLDYDAIEKQALEVKPLILLAGFSAYSRNINYARMRAIADRVGAVFMVDMAHFAGLVAGKVLQGEFNPIPYAHIVTTTTHKTLRGPRGGLVLCTDEFKEHVDRGCPLVLGGPLPHVMAAKAVAFTEALRPEFATYAHQIVANARALAEAFVREGLNVLTGGTDNHLLVLDVASTHGITGRQAEDAVRRCGITLNRNPIPFDPNGPWYTSGLRFGAAAVSTLGMGKTEMDEIASVVALVLKNVKPGKTKSGALDKTKYTLDETVRGQAHARVKNLLDSYPVYPEIDLPFLVQSLGTT
jgi:glycine hydroxymethyltransferase